MPSAFFILNSNQNVFDSVNLSNRIESEIIIFICCTFRIVVWWITWWHGELEMEREWSRSVAVVYVCGMVDGGSTYSIIIYPFKHLIQFNPIHPFNSIKYRILCLFFGIWFIRSFLLFYSIYIYSIYPKHITRYDEKE